MEHIELTKKQREDLGNIESLINTIMTNEDVDDEIRLLSIKHNVTKSFLTPVRIGLLSEKDLEYIKDLNNRIWKILEPVYENLSNTACEHMEEWFKRIRRASGDLDPQVYEYQKELAYWLLSAIIKHELPSELYTLLVSRGE